MFAWIQFTKWSERPKQWDRQTVGGPFQNDGFFANSKSKANFTKRHYSDSHNILSQRIWVIEAMTGDSLCLLLSHRAFIPSAVLQLARFCRCKYKSLTFITFESGSKLQRLDEYAFSWSVLTAFHIPASVELLCKGCFHSCQSLTSVTIESDSTIHQASGSYNDCCIWMRRIFKYREYPPTGFTCSRRSWHWHSWERMPSKRDL
jgi:hypothetical protein